MTKGRSPRITRGQIIVYRVFDVGNCVDLEAAARLLDVGTPSRRKPLVNIRREILVREEPLSLPPELWPLTFGGLEFEVSCESTLWSFGSLSLAMSFAIPVGMDLEALCNLHHELEEFTPLHALAEATVRTFLARVLPAVEKPELWHDVEDYTIFRFEAFSEPPGQLRHFFTQACFQDLLLSERYGTFGPNSCRNLADHMKQYTDRDMVLVHWNSAIVYDLQDPDKVAYTLEFALCQMHVLRYYDSLLDTQLQTLYKRIESSQRRIWSNPYEELSKQAALEYIDISEVVDRVENAFKVIGDFYFAMIYNLATQQFHLSEWKQSVNHKLENLAEVSKLFQGNVNERRNQLMELTIVILITIEVLPFLLKLVS